MKRAISTIIAAALFTILCSAQTTQQPQPRVWEVRDTTGLVFIKNETNGHCMVIDSARAINTFWKLLLEKQELYTAHVARAQFVLDSLYTELIAERAKHAQPGKNGKQ